VGGYLEPWEESDIFEIMPGGEMSLRGWGELSHSGGFGRLQGKKVDRRGGK